MKFTDTATEAVERLPRMAVDDAYSRRLAIKVNRRVLFIRVADIMRIEAAGNYVCLHTPDAVHRLRATMTTIEARLDPGTFIRVHRCTIVNIAHVEEILASATGGHAAVMTDGQRLSISRSYRARLRELIDEGFLAV